MKKFRGHVRAACVRACVRLGATRGSGAGKWFSHLGSNSRAVSLRRSAPVVSRRASKKGGEVRGGEVEKGKERRKKRRQKEEGGDRSAIRERERRERIALRSQAFPPFSFWRACACACVMCYLCVCVCVFSLHCILLYAFDELNC